MEIRKVLSANDIGLTGTHQAGMLVPKSDPELLRFFPPLNYRALNPRADFRVHIPELSLRTTLQFIYYNNKRVANGTRDEFRLTGLTSIFRDLHAEPDDCLVLADTERDEVILTLQRRNDRAGVSQPSRLQIKGWTVTRKDITA